MTTVLSRRTTARSLGGGPLGWLGRGVVRHPWYPVILWAAVILVAIVPAMNVGSVVSNSFGSPLPTSDESVRAQDLFTAQFPHGQQAPSSAIVLLEGANISGPSGKNATIAITRALDTDPNLHNVSSVVSLYAAYTGYLAGQAVIGWSFLGPASAGSSSLAVRVNQTSTELWLPIATYVKNWERLVVFLNPGVPLSYANWPAFAATETSFPNGTLGGSILWTFFYGSSALSDGFNRSFGDQCLKTENVTQCAELSARSTLLSAIPGLFPAAENRSIATLAISDVGIQNFSSSAAQRPIVTGVLGAEVGLSPAWLTTLWNAFPSGTPPTPLQLAGWAATEVASNPVDRFPLPMPAALENSFVNSAGTATLILVSFNASDNYAVNNSIVTYEDVVEIQHDVSQVLASSPQYAGISSYETGAAPLDRATSFLATSALSLLLLLTIVVLLVIMLLYFRAPAAPALSFGLIGVAAVLSLAVMFVLGKFVMPFNPEVQPVVLVFLMSIGTDYSVFLLARYREELVRGTPPPKAVEATVRWAGQSIATSGMAVMVVTVALSFSGISFLAQMGDVLFFTVLVALLVNLTLLPSVLVLVGPRLFWPNSGARFERYAERRRTVVREQRDYIGRAGRYATRRPVLVIAVIGLLSLPVVAVALTVPVSYDVTDIGLPAGEPAQVGYRHLTNDFGAGYTSPSYALVTFAQPISASGAVGAREFGDIAGLAAVMQQTPGVASVDSLAGGSGIPVSTWTNFSSLPIAQQIALNQTLGNYVGADGETVVFNFATNSSGFSAPAISVLAELRSRVDGFTSGRPEIREVVFGGAASVTQDIKTLVDQANQRMLTGAAIGLFLMMLLILGSAFVPLLALGAIGLAILWGWASTYLVVGIVEKEALIFLLPLILLILVLGLGMDYSVLLLTRVREERSKGESSIEAIRQAVTHAGGVITAAAVILGGAFLLLGLTSPLGLLAGIGLGIGIAVLLQAFVVQTYLTPAVLTLGKDWIWKGWQRSPQPPKE
ncbi:MAG: MMPL family transporter [Thermoplasmata archaeon]|nr:MMPL family transporter [Thermoplasmata archaeon]